MTAISAFRTVRDMPRTLLSALALLPDPYARAMRLQIDGATADDVAGALDVEQAAVGPMLQVADAKLRELLLEDPEDPETTRDHAPTTDKRNQP